MRSGRSSGSPPSARRVQLEADDVEAALHDAAQERQPGLDLLALGPHRADLVHGRGAVRSPR